MNLEIEDENNEEGNVTQLLSELANGSEQAATRLWGEIENNLIRIAKSRLSSVAASNRTSDEEDLANSVYFCILQGIDEGRFAKLKSSEDLWKLIAKIARDKAIDRKRKQGTQTRGGHLGGIRGNSVLGISHPGFEQFANNDDDFVTLLEVEELLNYLFQNLPEQLVEIATLHLEGIEQKEIAASLSISVSSVQRKVNLIRDRWRKILNEFDPDRTN